jgi:hypothetical protein
MSSVPLSKFASENPPAAGLLASPHASQEEPQVAPKGRAITVPAWRTGSDIGNDEGEIRTRPVVIAPGGDSAQLAEIGGLGG